MRKLIFIDHIYHYKTKSSNFFRDMLGLRFDVHTLYVDPDDFDIEAIKTEVRNVAEADSVIYVWQLDFMAPLFLPLGLPVFCSPMFDGSGVLPDNHWSFLSDVRFINFSVDLHEKARKGGAKSIYIKYFPEPYQPVEFGKGLRGFFWRRRPEHGLDIGLIDKIFGASLTSLHIHDVPDTAAGKAISLNTDGLRYPVTRSTWFDDVSEMHAVLDRCNFYIAPRLSEGIGMGFLEAMGRGMLVAAHDAPTHNEYILSWVNGILFNMGSESVGEIAMPERIAKRAHATAVLGWQNWAEQQEEIFDFIETADDVPRNMAITPELAIGMVSAYRKGLAAYRKALSDVKTHAAPAEVSRPASKPRVLLGGGFHQVENASERFFPVRVVWTSETNFTIVPLDDDEDLELVFREGRGKHLDAGHAKSFTIWRGGESLPLRFEPLTNSSFFRLILPKGSFKAYENLEIRADWPLFEVGPGTKGKRRKQGILLCEAGVELMQM